VHRSSRPWPHLRRDYFTAGVRAKNGQYYDLLAPLASADEAHLGAMEIARIVADATRQGLDCVTHGVFPIPQDRTALLRVLGWGGLLVAALSFAIALELTR
jgi:hypothetical protein